MAMMVGLTGGIGGGKSAVADCFIDLGIGVIDADRIAHRLSAPGTAEFAAIVECFGDSIVDADGNLARKKLADIIFADTDKKKQLEAILHPPIRNEMYARAREDARAYCILDIPLLIENAQHHEMHRVLVVACAVETRIQRLQNARGMTRKTIEQIINIQASEAQRLAAADDVIDNNGDIAALASQVSALHQKYLALFG